MFKILCIALVLQASADANEIQDYNFLINVNTLKDYDRFVQGRDPLIVAETDDTNISRHTMEMLVFKVATALGDCHCTITYSPLDIETPHARAIVEAKKGVAISHPISAMSSDSRVQDGLVLSDSILDEDEFYVGLYTNEARTEVLNLSDKAAIERLRFAVVRTWKTDRELIKERGFDLTETDDWFSLLKMILANRADVILQPFSRADDMSFEDSVMQEKFKPIPGFKIKFGQSRKYFVSTTHPQSTEFLKALNKGIANMKDSGLLRKLQYQSGVINPKVNDWVEF